MDKLQGCDVSHWNGRPDWAAAKSAGMKWAAVKFSQGDNITDAQAVRNVEMCRAVGLPVMPYHFLYPGIHAADQFTRFMATVEACGGWEGLLVPALDVEGDEHCQLRGMGSQTYCHRALYWLALLEHETGRPGAVYTYPSFNTEHGVGQRLGSRSLLWAASYGSEVPQFAGWPQATFWQYSDHGTWPGIGGGLDLDWFLGTENELRALLVGARQKPLVVGPDGQVIACGPEWFGDDRITCSWRVLLAKLGIMQTLTEGPPEAVFHSDTGRCFLGEARAWLAERGWGVFYRDMAQGPRVYIKRVAGGAA
jgi:GH25 family lysozyme M1 (1,4-beta-N-acetylmuramidase)